MNAFSPKRDRLTPLWEAEISVTPAVRATIKQWTTQPPAEICIGFSEQSAYESLSGHMKQKETDLLDDISRRLQLCVLFQLYVRYKESHDRSSRGAFASDIALTSLEDHKVVDNVQHWVAAGQTLTSLAANLGGYGILLVLPTTVPRSVWEAHLRRTSSRFDDVVNELRRRGICELARETGAYRVGQELADRLKLDPPTSSLLT